jgi:hypothetical protein
VRFFVVAPENFPTNPNPLNIMDPRFLPPTATFQREFGVPRRLLAGILPKLAATLTTITVLAILATAQAQTVVITNLAPMNYWAGFGTTNNSLTNAVSVVETGGGLTTNIVLALSGGNGTTVTGTLTPTAFTANGTSALVLAVTNAPKGFYPFTVSASGDAAYSTNFNLFVVEQWAQTNAGTTGNWSDSTKWAGGSVPSSSDSVYFDHSIPGPWTNVVDSTRSIQDLVYLGNGDDGGSASSALNTTIAPSATLSVLGTNGFIIGKKANTGVRPTYYFFGNSLIVSNPVANFDLTDASANGSRYLTVNMANLTNLQVTVNRMAVADSSILLNNANSADGSQTVNFTLAQTNIITALFADNYSNSSFCTSIQYDRQDQSANNGQVSGGGFFLGISNAFYADSIGVGMGGANGSGTTPFSVFGYQMRFIPANQNATNPFCSAYFRGTNGGLMSLLAVGMDAGPGIFAAKNDGVLDLRGGKSDILVDKIWLAGNKTNLNTAETQLGGLYFDHGTVNANTIEVGYMRYTNLANSIGYLLVGTNGTLVANTYIELGHTPTDPTTPANWPNALATGGQLMITNGGTVLANQINMGEFTTNTAIIIAPYSSLVVSNTIGQATNGLAALILNGGSITFPVSSGVTNAYVTNILSTTTPTTINIASVPQGQSTNVLMVYQTANQAPNVSIGTLPVGFNNMQIVVSGGTGPGTISLIVSTNAPKNLAWRGGQNAQWDHSSLDWLDTNTATITKFTDGDHVIFDDTHAVPTTITVTESVNPNQTGVGMLVTNNINSFIFTNNPSGAIGSCTLLKAGTAGLEIDAPTTVGAQLNNGILVIGGTGSVDDATTEAGTIFTNSGTVSGGVTCSGTLQNPGTIDGSLSLQTPCSAVNSGTVNGPLAMQAGTLLNNSGLFSAIGAATVTTNSILMNSGVIYGTTLTVALGGTLTDAGTDSVGITPGSINVDTLTISGDFYPDGTGNSIGLAKVTDYDYAGSQQGAPDGRIQFNAGSVTTFKVNLASTPSNTELLSQSTVLGPSGSARSISGGTFAITNFGPAFVAGQSFQVIGQYYLSGMAPGNAGLNTTNSYPVIVPSVPGPGLVWDLTQLYSKGIIGIANASAYQVTMGSTMTITSGTNLVTALSWPAGFSGYGWVQQQISTLTNGLGTNWTDIGQSDYVDNILITNNLTTTPVVFYRFVIP